MDDLDEETQLAIALALSELETGRAVEEIRDDIFSFHTPVQKAPVITQKAKKVTSKATMKKCEICDETKILVNTSVSCIHTPKYCSQCVVLHIKEAINGKGTS